MKFESGNWRMWVFRGLVLAPAVIMLMSATQLWWRAQVDHLYMGYQGQIRLYQYGVAETPGEDSQDLTPGYQMVLGHLYIAASIGLVLWSTWLRGKKGAWLLGGVGLAYLMYTAVAIIWIANRAAVFGLPLQGYGTYIGTEREKVVITTTLRSGYFLACAAGLSCVLLALLRAKFAGKIEPTLIGNGDAARE